MDKEIHAELDTTDMPPIPIYDQPKEIRRVARNLVWTRLFWSIAGILFVLALVGMTMI